MWMVNGHCCTIFFKETFKCHHGEFSPQSNPDFCWSQQTEIPFTWHHPPAWQWLHARCRSASVGLRWGGGRWRGRAEGSRCSKGRSCFSESAHESVQTQCGTSLPVRLLQLEGPREMGGNQDGIPACCVREDGEDGTGETGEKEVCLWWRVMGSVSSYVGLTNPTQCLVDSRSHKTFTHSFLSSPFDSIFPKFDSDWILTDLAQ